jgi:predicted nuclease of restriction endonuclease-like (RecB) superfamily
MCSNGYQQEIRMSNKPIKATSRTVLPSAYAVFLTDLKSRIRTAQVKASLAVNRELIELYWSIGRDIVQRQHTEAWGKAIVERLSRDIRSEFPGLRGFSPQNIWYMRAFHQAWAVDPVILQQPVGELDAAIPAQSVRKLSHSILQQSVGEIPSQPVRESASAIVARPVRQLVHPILPQAVAELPWGHNILLITKLKDPTTRLWYARQTITHGWSRNILSLQIESQLHLRQGQAVNNFAATLPPAQSDLAAQILKDPYVFDFLTIAPDALERALETDLVNHITRFLLELGNGFAFVGRQFHLEVDGDDYYLDLLFYHVKLHCYIVLDLKAGPFKPEFAGKMNFYLSAADDLLRSPSDQPTIGLLLCRDQKRITAEYALRDVAKPIGVAGWQAKITAKLPKNLRGSLPTVEQLEKELGGNRAR